MRRRLLPIVVLLALSGSLAGALSASAPSRLPAVALGAVLVWRVEVAASVFVPAYLALAALRLSLHGRTFTRVGSAGVEIPDVTAQRAAQRAEDVKMAELGVTLAEFRAWIDEIEGRMRSLEDARDVLLRFERGDLA